MMIPLQWLMPFLALSAPYGDYDKEEISVLVTSAYMQEIDHGILEAWYPDALLYHAKIDSPREKDTAEGFLALDENNVNRRRTGAIVARPDGQFTYTVKGPSLFSALGLEIPQGYHLLGNAPSDQLTLPATALALELMAIPGKLADAAGSGQRGKTVVFPPIEKTQKAYYIEFAPRGAGLEKQHEEYLKGFQGDKEAGRKLHRKIFATKAITTEILPSSPVGSKLTERPVTTSPFVKGWYVSAPRLHSLGRVFLPLSQPSVEASAGTLDESLSTQEITVSQLETNDVVGVTSFRMDATEFIDRIFRVKVAKGSTAQERPFGCKINRDNLEATACRPETLKDGRSERFWIYVNLENDEDHQKRGNEFFIWNPVTKEQDHRVTVFANTKAAPPPQRFPPIRWRGTK